MCGIAGFLDPRGFAAGSAEIPLRRMADALAHRGPDGDGFWTDPDAGIALAHRRLAVIDPSPLGRQPMQSASGRYQLVFNGEIYGFRALRAELERGGSRFRGGSDTEVLLEAVDRWGLAQALERCDGMFALALWDRARRVLHLARDRAGEKPVHYGWMGPVFAFGSELKALAAHPAFTREVDRDALAHFVRGGCVPAPHSIYRGIHKLLPGHRLELHPGSREPRLVAYWSMRAAAEAGAGDPFRGSADEAVEAVDALVRDAVRLRLEADVPLGAFLSGGIDSSLVVAMMRAAGGGTPVRTFTIGFGEAEYDEAPFAAAVAAELGTEHTALYATPEDALATIPGLAEVYDEPFADSSQIPTLLVSRLARRQVTVVLSGDGGDELFAGYPRHLHAAAWARAARLPLPLRRAAAAAAGALPPAGWDALLRPLVPLLPRGLAARSPGARLAQAAGTLAHRSPEALHAAIVGHWTRGAWPLVDAAPHPAHGGRRGLGPVERMLYLDAAGYLPDDILAKVDRATMSVGLEARAPLLDRRVMELAWRLPLGTKVRGWEGKWVLRRVLERYLPRERFDRPKMGFCVPVGRWLRGPLRDWAEALLDERRLRDQGFFRPTPVRAAWREHLAGTVDREQDLWNVLMFQAWLERWGTSVPAALTTEVAV